MFGAHPKAPLVLYQYKQQHAPSMRAASPFLDCACFLQKASTERGAVCFFFNLYIIQLSGQKSRANFDTHRETPALTGAGAALFVILHKITGLTIQVFT